MKSLPSIRLRIPLGVQGSPERTYRELFDEAPQDTGSTEASPRVKFFETFRDLRRTRPKRRKGAAALLSHYEKEKLMPLPLGFGTPKGSSRKLRLNGYCLSDRYAEALSSGLKGVRSLESLELKRNQLSEAGSLRILKSVSAIALREIDLSYNRIGEKAIWKLIEICNLYDTKLTVLDLEQTSLKDNEIEILCRGLRHNKSLRHLNLANNKVKGRGARALGEMLRGNKGLLALDLHWNELGQEGAGAFFDGLAENAALLQLDLSWNALGADAEGVLPALSRFFAENSTLRHLDISYNSLKLPDCKLLAASSLENHSILGVHLAGNECSVDSRGFLRPQCGIQGSPKGFRSKRILVNGGNRTGDNCWLCEQWVEHTFSVESNGKVFIHIHLEEPILMEQDGEYWTHTQMLPPREITYFFTDETGGFLLGNAESVVPSGPHCKLQFAAKTPPRTLPCAPRASPRAPPRAWGFSTSLFKDYIQDSPSLLSSCFEFDWGHSKVPSQPFTSSKDLSESKSLLRASYSQLRCTYKSLSMSHFSEVFSVSSNTVLEFLSQAKVFDNLYGSSDFGVNFNASLVQKVPGQVFNPGNALVRYEFIELLVRIAVDKYFRSGQVQSVAEALAMLFRALGPTMALYDYNAWRDSYFTEEVEGFLRANEELIQTVFSMFSGKKTLPGHKPFMSVEEFREFCAALGCSVGREIDQCFGYSLMTQQDELFSKRHLEMTLLEFYEGMTRVHDLMTGHSQEPLHKRLRTLRPALCKILQTKAPH